MIDFRNTNTVWASVLVETLHHLGLTTAIICPGSRSTPLAIAFAAHPKIAAIPVLDERSAAFFALGLARQSNLPVAIVCTSGTAGANFYPAVIEARESRVPLLVLTADRPPELRDCHAGQAIDQLKLYGHYPNWQAELAAPSLDIAMLRYLRQTLIYGWQKTLFPVPGVVHLNVPLRDPLPPLPEPDRALAIDRLRQTFDAEDFFAHCCPPSPQPPQPPLQRGGYGGVGTVGERFIPEQIFPQWQGKPGIIIAGPAQPSEPETYCQAIAQLAQTFDWPVLAEGLSPVRNYAAINPDLISTYDLILRNQNLAETLTPEIVVQIGELPISKQLRQWLETQNIRRFVIDPSDHNLDPLHGPTIHLTISVGQLAIAAANNPPNPFNSVNSAQAEYRQKWADAESQVREAISQTFASINHIIEPKLAWVISQSLPIGTPLFIANSMPVRDVEYFWQPGNLQIRPFFNRGANGIDGTLSTALGIAHRQQPSVMLTGDLALLHDTNGFLLCPKFQGHLTIILINNNGGGIFEMLPVAQFDPPFEEFFATPQQVDFGQLFASYGVEHQLISSWEKLRQLLNPLPSQGIRVLELRCDRKFDAQWRKQTLLNLASILS
ncbi:2-succinyl-5-enolpyruvyl-6-hydroxy-3-cyclohexene-1-carboxylic-acid synthase [Planktothricoides raciborskii]|uniref:2-succinyl-5-enolpyruvyl-6-hydroxy-3-cyclohexene-1-carboxylate synthase n=2 Tax=Planktothricoides raciborskii TaxID=132608 RepID=A0AAU8JI75_9CYAN|nr:2-succinyl-5-enolpyruvyl-6-hydroxy-3-cyclohexene-1-carboxylic-acid synthase [Planktothricoides raciborskii]MBD2543760.1 2-succinyl-5-enolpyruvyl-6-hydroxy-3-cyclohexene-1-carboxylic-acid synthase [Planktothricoides raciborskii FACHB-1370]MBD2582345.1 2-succinyl-5-enolpyruvyl-6-hydroxy-3-cyclohexene-1-carboxylic-acid synthase [Planktothricoides raciborskii FACHB-1261]